MSPFLLLAAFAALICARLANKRLRAARMASSGALVKKAKSTGAAPLMMRFASRSAVLIAAMQRSISAEINAGTSAMFSSSMAAD